MNQHQAAIWGAGGIAQTHAMALRAVGIPIRTVVSHSEAGARDFAEQWGDSRVVHGPGGAAGRVRRLGPRLHPAGASL